MYGSTGYSNGYHQNQQQQSSEERRGGGRGRRGGRRSRDPHGFRVYEHQYHLNNNKEEQKTAPPCTDFDMAYFHSYAHVGIHEEMIKVFLLLPLLATYLFLTGFILFSQYFFRHIVNLLYFQLCGLCFLGILSV